MTRSKLPYWISARRVGRVRGAVSGMARRPDPHGPGGDLYLQVLFGDTRHLRHDDDLLGGLVHVHRGLPGPLGQAEPRAEGPEEILDAALELGAEMVEIGREANLDNVHSRLLILARLKRGKPPGHVTRHRYRLAAMLRQISTSPCFCKPAQARARASNLLPRRLKCSMMAPMGDIQMPRPWP